MDTPRKLTANSNNIRIKYIITRSLKIMIIIPSIWIVNGRKIRDFHQIYTITIYLKTINNQLQCNIWILISLIRIFTTNNSLMQTFMTCLKQISSWISPIIQLIPMSSQLYKKTDALSRFSLCEAHQCFS